MDFGALKVLILPLSLISHELVRSSILDAVEFAIKLSFAFLLIRILRDLLIQRTHQQLLLRVRPIILVAERALALLGPKGGLDWHFVELTLARLDYSLKEGGKKC